MSQFVIILYPASSGSRIVVFCIQGRVQRPEFVRHREAKKDFRIKCTSRENKVMGNQCQIKVSAVYPSHHYVNLLAFLPVAM